jgi:hypothetical protein
LAGAVSLTHASLPPLFLGCALLTLAVAGAHLVWIYAAVPGGVGARVRATVAAMGFVLLTPVALHAWDGDQDDDQRRWIYAVDSASGRLVRLGHQGTAPAELADTGAALSGGNGADVESTPARRWQVATGSEQAEYSHARGCGGDVAMYQHERIGAAIAMEMLPGPKGSGSLGRVGHRVELSFTRDAWRKEAHISDPSSNYDPDPLVTTGISREATLGYWAMLHGDYVGGGVRLSLGANFGDLPPDHRPILLGGLHSYPAVYMYAGWPVAAVELGVAAPFQSTTVTPASPFFGLRSKGDWGVARLGVAASYAAQVYLSGEVPIAGIRLGAYLAMLTPSDKKVYDDWDTEPSGFTLLLSASFDR